MASLDQTVVIARVYAQGGFAHRAFVFVSMESVSSCSQGPCADAGRYGNQIYEASLLLYDNSVQLVLIPYRYMSTGVAVLHCY